MEIKASWIFQPVEVGYQRAAVFLGLGCNAARRPDFTDYLLTRESGFQLLPDTVSPDTIAEWKEQFYRWIVTGGFREIVEFTCIFLDRLYDCSMRIHKQHSGKAFDAFARKGIPGKIDALRDQFGISCRYPSALASIYAVRNCLVHRVGVVGPEDIKNGGQLSLSWIATKAIFQGEDGKEYDMPDLEDPKSKPWPVPCAGGVALMWGEKTRTFTLGEVMELEPHALHEILFFVRNSCDDFVKSFVAKAEALGKIKKPPV